MLKPYSFLMTFSAVPRRRLAVNARRTMPRGSGCELAAHHLGQVVGAVSAAQQVHVAVELAFGHQHRPEALDRHVGQGEQLVEHHATVFGQVALVVGLQCRLRWRQAGALRVVDRVQRQPGSLLAVAQRVEPTQPADAGIEGALAALPVDVVFQIARHRGHHLDAVLGQEPVKPLLAGFFEDGEVAAVDHPHSPRTRRQGQGGVHDLSGVVLPF